jgi:hypothetical protein
MIILPGLLVQRLVQLLEQQVQQLQEELLHLVRRASQALQILTHHECPH